MTTGLGPKQYFSFPGILRHAVGSLNPIKRYGRKSL